jgi:hypothetical protein
MRSGDRPGLQKRPYHWAASRTNGLGGSGSQYFGPDWPDLPPIVHAIKHSAMRGYRVLSIGCQGLHSGITPDCSL